MGLCSVVDFGTSSGEPVDSAATWLTNLQLVHESVTCHVEKYIG